MEKIDEEIRKLKKIVDRLYRLGHNQEADDTTSIILALEEKSK